MVVGQVALGQKVSGVFVTPKKRATFQVADAAMVLGTNKKKGDKLMPIQVKSLSRAYKVTVRVS